MKRIVTCQGSIQLIAALSALFYRDRSHNSGDQNYLVIYELYAPDQQHHEFATFIQRMAESIGDWESIVYLTPEQLDMIGHRLDSTPPDRIYNTVHQWIGIDHADELYLCRNWQFTNQLLSNAYPTASRICYGDGIGLYFSENSAVVRRPFVVPPTPDQLLDWTWWKARSVWHRIRERLKLKTKLYSMPFDVGYFVLPEIFGETPPMPIVKLDPNHLLMMFKQFAKFVDRTQVAEVQSAVAQFPVSILLTSNFSEGERLSQDSEIKAYREFLTAHERLPNSVLIIKPHPRDDLRKIHRLKESLSDLYQDIVLLTDPNLFFLPFEVFFLEALQNCDARVFAVSSACLSLKLLFDVPSFIGFGTNLTNCYFDSDFIAARLEHEQTLHDAIDQL